MSAGCSISAPCRATAAAGIPTPIIDELRKLRKHHPELWEKLLELDRRALAQFGPGPLGQFKQNWSVERLDERFAKEDGQTA